MAEPGIEQKLAAILAADVAGYTRLMAEDEPATIATITEYRTVFRSNIEANGGRVVDMAGDSVLAVFTSAAGAVKAALDAQGELARCNEELAEDRRMHFRIGVNLGDIREADDGTVYGDGVNVAARLEGLAEPGGVMISEDAHRQVRRNPDHAFADAGAHEVKNVAEPVRAYRVLADGEVAPRTRSAPRLPMALAAVAVAALAGITIWQLTATSEHIPDASDRADPGDLALALPAGPSIVVLPFVNLSDDPTQDYFVDGVTDDLITSVSKIPEFFVIARNSAFTYKDKPTKVQQVAADLGVRYVLEGSVRRIEDQLRINAQLIDAETGHHLWAERYDGAPEGVFDFQDLVIAQIVANLAAEIGAGLDTASGDGETQNLEAYDAFLLGREYLRRVTSADTKEAIAHFDRAIEIDPNYSQAYAGLAAAYLEIVSLERVVTNRIQDSQEC